MAARLRWSLLAAAARWLTLLWVSGDLFLNLGGAAAAKLLAETPPAPPIRPLRRGPKPSTPIHPGLRLS
jgi:hypothetical protein